jgi:lysophospholipase L1-like esterase
MNRYVAMASVALVATAFGFRRGRKNDHTSSPQARVLTLSFASSGARAPTDSTTVMACSADELLAGTPTCATGGTWTLNGTVPTVSSTALYPSGFSGAARKAAGPFSDANYFSMASPDPLDLTTYTVGILHQPVALHTAGSETVALSDGAATGTGLYLELGQGPNALNFYDEIVTNGSATATAVGNDTAADTASAPNFFCAGRDGAALRYWTQQNLGTAIFSTAAAMTADSTHALKLGRYDAAGFAYNGLIYEVVASSSGSSQYLCDLWARTLYGHVATSGQGLTVTRTTAATSVVGGTRYAYPPNALRIASDGALVEPARTQKFSAPTAPATQTLTLSTGAHTFWLEGSGSYALTVGTATVTGLPCTATSSSQCHFTVTGAGTVTATKTGTVTVAQCETGSFATSLITGPSRTTDAVGVLDWSAFDGQAGSWSVTLVPEWNCSTIGTDRTIWSAASAGLTVRASDCKLSYVIGGVTVLSAAQTITANSPVTWSGTYALGGQACLTASGATTCGGTVSALSLGGTLYLGGSSTDAAGGGFKGTWTVSNRSAVKQLLAMGDSITYGFGAGTTYEAVAAADLGGTWTSVNGGFNGDTSSGVAMRWAGTYRGSGARVVVVLAGVNDIGNEGRSAAYVEANLQTIYDQVLVDGQTLVVATILPWGNSSAWTSGGQTKTAAVNTWIAAYAVAHPGVHLLDAYAVMGDSDPTKLKATYDQGDGVHPNDAGQTALGHALSALLP